MKLSISDIIFSILGVIGLISSSFIILYFGVSLMKEYFSSEIFLVKLVASLGIAFLTVLIISLGFEHFNLFKKGDKK